MGYLSVVKSIPGAVHFYALNTEFGAKDLIGTVNGTNYGVTFTDTGGVFGGNDYVELPDHNDFSVVTKGGLTVVSQLTVTDWSNPTASEYVHWMGKGGSNAQEWTFRHYVQGGTGEASTRQGRISFYHFNLSGGEGAGSYVQEGFVTGEMMIAGACNTTNTFMWKNGTQRDTDALSGYNISLRNASAPVRIGTRDKSTGYLVGRLRNVIFFNRTLTSAEHAKLYAARNEPLLDHTWGWPPIGSV